MSHYTPRESNDLPSGNEFDIGQDYDLLSYILSLGGQVVGVGEGVPAGRGYPSGEAPSWDISHNPLSKAHISPHIEYRAGASLLKAHRGGETEIVTRGKRGQISGFSAAARRRLMYTIGGIRRSADLPMFVTLTYPATFPDPKIAKRHLDTFFKRLARVHPHHGTIWKLEPQERGAPHFHMMIWGVDLAGLFPWVPSAWYEIAGGGDPHHLQFHLGVLRDSRPCVEPVRDWRGVWSYASKYLGKTFEVSGWQDKWTGRYWGVVNRDNVPFGDLVVQEVDRSKAVEVMRYQRRFSKLKKRNNKSLTIFCDADQWIDRLEIGGDLVL